MGACEATGPQFARRGAWLARELLANGEADRAYNMAYRWLERHGDSSLAADAYLLRADAMVAMGDYYESLYDYEFVIRRYPASPTFTLALTRELEIASLFANGTRRKVFGLRIGDASDEAEELFIRIQERAPGSQLAEQAGIELADMYFRQRRMELAADMYAIFIEKYPKSPFIDKARRRLIYANIATFKGPQFDIVDFGKPSANSSNSSPLGLRRQSESARRH